MRNKPSDNSDLALKKRWVKNLSSKELTELERKGLEHGLKFAVAPKRIPIAEIVASVEEGIFHLNDETKLTVSAEVSSILRRAKIPPSNIDSNVFEALLALKKDPDRVYSQQIKATALLLWTKISIARKPVHC